MFRRTALPALALFALAAGCQPPQPAMGPPGPTDAYFRPAVAHQVVDQEEFTGRTEAAETVEVRARVSGYLDKVYFKEGAEVKKGDPLFEIDPKLLKAELKRTEGLVAQVEARETRLKAEFTRLDGLRGTASPVEIERVTGDLGEAVAAVKSARAAQHTAELNLEYTKVMAPLSGRISRKLVDVGNTIKAEETALTWIVNLDDVYAYFDVDERTYLRIQRYLERGLEVAAKEMPVYMGLADEKGHPHTGTITFVDNRVDPNTGSVWVRGSFPNPKKLFTAGLFVRVRVPVGDPHTAVLIPERALVTDQGQKFVYVIEKQDGKEIAVYRPIEVGPQHGQMREVLTGVKEGDRVVVRNLQRIRPKAEVAPKEDTEIVDKMTK